MERKALTSKTKKRLAQVVWEGEEAFSGFVRGKGNISEISRKNQIQFILLFGRLHCAFFL